MKDAIVTTQLSAIRELLQTIPIDEYLEHQLNTDQEENIIDLYLSIYYKIMLITQNEELSIEFTAAYIKNTHIEEIETLFSDILLINEDCYTETGMPEYDAETLILFKKICYRAKEIERDFE